MACFFDGPLYHGYPACFIPLDTTIGVFLFFFAYSRCRARAWGATVRLMGEEGSSCSRVCDKVQASSAPDRASRENEVTRRQGNTPVQISQDLIICNVVGL